MTGRRSSAPVGGRSGKRPASCASSLPAVPSSAERRLVDAFTVRDDSLQPKSVVATGDGLFFTQNMMYRHNVAVFDRSGTKVATIPDRVDLGCRP